MQTSLTLIYGQSYSAQNCSQHLDIMPLICRDKIPDCLPKTTSHEWKQKGKFIVLNSMGVFYTWCVNGDIVNVIHS